MATPRKPRKTLDERIIESAARVAAEKRELARLQAIQDMAGPRSEWVDGLLTEYGIPAQPKDSDEKVRLAELREAMSGSDAGLQQRLDEAEKALETAKETSSRRWRAVDAMAREFGLAGTNGPGTWRNVRERYNIE